MNPLKETVLDKPTELNLNHTKPVFARHETFHPRYGWLKKAVDRVIQEPEVFTQPDAPVQLGVGKNMVTAIRYWAQAYKLIEESAGEGKNRAYQPTEYGSKLLTPDGWDPYLEDIGSLWLLHWLLLKPACQATTWYFLFNHYPHAFFSLDDALYSLAQYKEITFPSANVVESSLKKDLHCLVRMYSTSDAGSKQVLEDSISSPFSELGLIQHVRAHYYQFNFGYKPSLPALIIAYACTDFASQRKQGKTINMNTLQRETGSPGLVFKLNESSLYEALEAVDRLSLGLKISESAGLVQLVFEDSPVAVGQALLDYYYQK